MATKEKKNAEYITCFACHQLFKSPKYLPCHHSYCEECLEKMQTCSKIVCPKCKKEAAVPAGGVKEFNSNFLIMRLVDELILKRKVDREVEVKCDACLEDNPVENFCPDCVMFLCCVCNEYHKRSAKSHDHCTVTLTELKSSKDISIQSKTKVLLCSEHDYELKHYCESCDKLVCLYCTMKKHSDHSHDTVKNLVGMHKEELNKITDPIEEMIRSLSEAHDKIEKTMSEETQEQIDELHKRIDEHYDKIIQKLMEQKKG